MEFSLLPREKRWLIGKERPYARMRCNTCLGCRMERVTELAVRSMHETTGHTHSYGPFKGAYKAAFITLTYNDAHLPGFGTCPGAHYPRHDVFKYHGGELPYDQVDFANGPPLHMRDWQLFLKRLRRQCPEPLRFLHSGEYGEKNRRPHFHSLIWGEDFHRDRKILRNATPTKDALYVSPTVEAAWTCPSCREPNGFHTIGTVSFASAAYTARYALKKVFGEGELERVPHVVDKATGEAVPIHPYSTWSRRPGLGREVYDNHRDEIYARDSCILQVDGKSRHFRVPRYYDRLLGQDDPDFLEYVQQARVERAKKHKTDPRDEIEINLVRQSLAAAHEAFRAQHREHL